MSAPSAGGAGGGGSAAGSAGQGGAANAASAVVNGQVYTSGVGNSYGVLVQSLGGVGGNGGHSGSWFNPINGNGNQGGASSTATITGTGATVQTGNSSYQGENEVGVMAQSIGGGGGVGPSSTDGWFAVGGDGGDGSDGQAASATLSASSVLTYGFGSAGIAAQSIGGGGKGGDATKSSGVIVNMVVGGTGGNGGGAHDAFAGNDGGLVDTLGDHAAGLLLQSIGGGGGAGGKAGTSMGDGKSNDDGSNGSDDDVSTTLSGIAADFAKNGTAALANYDSLAELLVQTNRMLGNDTSGVGSDDPADTADSTAESGGETQDDNETLKTSINVSIGGSGGKGGAGGVIEVDNFGDIATMGKHSDGIVVQSIGGGGGKGGAASTASSADWSGSVAIGGTGGGSSGPTSNASNGGQARVSNSGQVITVGALSNAIVAQSVGSGGGIGGSSTASVTGSGGEKTVSLSVSLGGSAGLTGISETASVTSSGAIETRGHDSYGIIAQSVSGGSGIVKTLATDLDNAGGSANASSSKDFAANIALGGGKSNTARPSGAAQVTTTAGGTIVTRGDNSFGILAQSVAAGGGLAQGGKPNGTSAAAFLGSGSKTGSVNPGLSPNADDNQGVMVTVGDDIATSGAGAVGVFAQSVGGSGGIAGDIGWTMQKVQIARGSQYNGNGGNVQVTLEAGAAIATSGGNAPAIIAQSVGGGGGWIANKQGAFVGSAGGTGSGGPVTVDVAGAVTTTGYASIGVYAQSTGGADNGGTGRGQAIAVTVAATGAISVGQADQQTPYNGDGAAIYLANGTGNTVVNNGTVKSFGTVRNAVAVYSTGGDTAVRSPPAPPASPRCCRARSTWSPMCRCRTSSGSRAAGPGSGPCRNSSGSSWRWTARATWRWRPGTRPATR